MDDKKERKQRFGSIFKKQKSDNTDESDVDKGQEYKEPADRNYASLIDKAELLKKEDIVDDDLSSLLLKFQPESREKEEIPENEDEKPVSTSSTEISPESSDEPTQPEEESRNFSDLIQNIEQKNTKEQTIPGVTRDSGSSELKMIFEQMKKSEGQGSGSEPAVEEPEYTGETLTEPVWEKEAQAGIDEEDKTAENETYASSENTGTVEDSDEVQEDNSKITDSQSFFGGVKNEPKTLQEIINSVTRKTDEIPDTENEDTYPEEHKEEPVEIITEPEKTFDIRTQKSHQAKKTQWSEDADETEESGIISVDQHPADFSGLILPEGATFEIEEFKIKTRKRTNETEDRESVLSKIDNIIEKDASTVQIPEVPEEEPKEEGKKEKKGFFSKFKAEIGKHEHYSPNIHGPLVNLQFKAEEGLEEIELYPVNEPYAYVRIVYDKNSNEYLYKILEPELNDAEKELYAEIEQRLFETLDVNTKSISKDEACEILKTAVLEILRDYGIKLTPDKREKIIYTINKNFIGDGLIDPLMHDKYIEDISCDGLNTPIFVFHSNYESLQTNLIYTDSANLDSFVTKLAQRAGKYISIAEPMLDATMSDGSRIQMTLGTEVTAHGSTFTIRKFKEEPITPTDLTEWGTFSPLSIAYIWIAVEAGKSCIFAGGTASGKTTSLNAISLFIPPLAKIVTLEDTRELKLPHKNWIPSITRESFDADGKGTIDMYELLRAALRQRPEYILVGEVRGQEALTLFQAMSTGHVTYATMHADSVASAVHRLENPPLNVPRNMLNALDLVSVQVQARIGGKRIRRNKQLIEVLDIDPRTKELITNEVFKWYPSTDEIRYSGKSYVLEEIMEERGWDDDRMKEELKRRQEILEWMRIKNLRHYKDVGRVLMSYFRDPDAVIKLVRTELYE